MVSPSTGISSRFRYLTISSLEMSVPSRRLIFSGSRGSVLSLGNIVDDVDGAVQHVARSPASPPARRHAARQGRSVMGSRPFSNLPEASVRMPSCQSGLADGGAVERWRTRTRPWRCRPMISEFSPPMIPAKADGLFSSAMTSMPACPGCALVPSSVVRVSPASAFAHDDLAGRYIAVIKGVHGLAVFQHDVVGDVHDVVDGTHAVGAQTVGAASLGEGAILTLATIRAGVAVAQLRSAGTSTSRRS